MKLIMLDISIIIVNYNTKHLLLRCIESIYKYSKGFSFEIIVVDNASKDGSKPAVISRFPKVIWIGLDENLGFGRANNLGSERAKGKYLYLLNSDCELIENSILHLFEFKQHCPKHYGVIGQQLLNQNGQECHSYGNFPSMRSELFKILQIKRMSNPIMFKLENFGSGFSGHQVPYITGADMFMEKELFQQFQGFDPRFFFYYEESDLQLRLNQAGYGSFLLAQGRLIHGYSESFNKISNKFLRQTIAHKSMLHYFSKHAKPLNFLIFKYLYFLLRTIILLYPSRNFEQKVTYLKNIWRLVRC